MILEAAMKAESVKMKTQSSTVVDLLVDCWFFMNVLITRETPSSDDTCAKEESEGADGRRRSQERVVSSDCRDTIPALHRMLTLPPQLRQLRRMDAAQEEAAPSLSACNPKLRHSLSSLDNYRSSSSSTKAVYSPSMARDRPPRYIKLERSERYLTIQHYIAKEAYYRKIFKEKKWRSHSDLEYIEVQGFKDLGFVFDKKELNTSLVMVLPGLSDKKTCNGEKITGPYLSEARVQQKSAPPMFRCVDKSSADDMKEQLMFWARAVACNARQES